MKIGPDALLNTTLEKKNRMHQKYLTEKIANISAPKMSYKEETFLKPFIFFDKETL